VRFVHAQFIWSSYSVVEITTRETRVDDKMKNMGYVATVQVGN